MAYDEALAGRIRALLGERPGLAEKKMFGGLAFLVGGNMAVAASAWGGILVRVDPGGVGRARRLDSRVSAGDARPPYGGLAPRRRCRRRRRRDTGSVGRARRELRRITSGEVGAQTSTMTGSTIGRRRVRS